MRENVMTHPESQFFDFYRANLKAAGDATRASLEGSARLRKKQLEHIDEALVTHARLVAEIHAAKDIEALIAASGKLAGAQYRSLIGYWNAIYEAIGENQAELSRLAQSQVEQLRGDIDGTLAAAQVVPVPVLAALQPLMEVASSAYALTARATAEATKLAAAQLAGANGAGKQPAKQAQRQSAG
jgi:hypothetical protein